MNRNEVWFGVLCGPGMYHSGSLGAEIVGQMVRDMTQHACECKLLKSELRTLLNVSVRHQKSSWHQVGATAADETYRHATRLPFASDWICQVRQEVIRIAIEGDMSVKAGIE